MGLVLVGTAAQPLIEDSERLFVLAVAVGNELVDQELHERQNKEFVNVFHEAILSAG